MNTPRLALALCAALLAPPALAQPAEPFRIGALFTTYRHTNADDLRMMAGLDEMAFNYWYVGVLDHITAPHRAAFEAAAARAGARLRTPTLQPIVPGDVLTTMDRLTTGWDIRIHAEDARVATVVHGRPTSDPLATPAGGPNAVVSTGTRGVVVQDNAPADLLWASFRDPRGPSAARVRFRLRWDGSAPPRTPVARVSASRLARDAEPAPGNPAADTLRAEDFATCPRPCYVEVALELDQRDAAVRGGRRAAGEYFRYAVEHLGPGALYVDYVHVDTETARRVLAGAYDQALVAYLRANGFDTPLYDGFSVKDEPEAFNMTSIGRLSDAVEAALGRRASTVVVGHHQADFFAYYLETVRPPRLITDPYFLGTLAYPGTCSPYGPRGLLANPDVPPDQRWGLKPYDAAEYHADLQTQLDCLAGALGRAAGEAERAGVPFWYVPQAHGIFGQDAPDAPWSWRGLRQVSAAEARLITYLGVAYGARGVIYHLYKTVEPGGNDVNVGMVSNGHRVGGGAVEPLNGHADDYDRDLVRAGGAPVPVYTGYRRVREAFRRVNAELAAAGPTLVRLRRTATYDASGGHPSASPIAAIREGAGAGAGAAGHLQVGVLDDPAGTARYVVLVNRMARPEDTRALTVTLRGPHPARAVVDVTTGETVAQLPAGAGAFALTMGPGDGRILRIAP